MVDVTNGSGALQEKVHYDAFGNMTVTPEAGGGSLAVGDVTWTGQSWDSTISMFDMHRREYDPSMQQFLQQDAMGFSAGDPNLRRMWAMRRQTRPTPAGCFRLPSLYHRILQDSRMEPTIGPPLPPISSRAIGRVVIFRPETLTAFILRLCLTPTMLRLSKAFTWSSRTMEPAMDSLRVRSRLLLELFIRHMGRTPFCGPPHGKAV